MELLRTRVLHADPPVLQVDGEIDISTADELRKALEEAQAADPSFLVDMSRVTFFDAYGLRVLLEVAAPRNGAGPLTLLNAPRSVKRVLDVVGMSHLPTLDLQYDSEHRDR